MTFGPRWLSRKEKTVRRVDLRRGRETLHNTELKYYRALERGKRTRRTRRSVEWATGEEQSLMGRR